MSGHPALGPARMRRVGRAYVAENAVVTADVSLGAEANVWFGAVIRGDDANIVVGSRTNVQDAAVIHVDPDAENIIGDGVTIGHGAICHGVKIHDHVLIGMGAILLSRSEIGEGAVVGAGAVVSEGMAVPPWSLAVGVPARVVRAFDEEERRDHAIRTATHYVVRAEEHAAGAWDGKVDVGGEL